MSITFDEIDRLTGFALGMVDTPCPECGPGRTAPANRTRKVLRIWRQEPGFASYKCARCGLSGWVRECHTLSPNRFPERVAEVEPSRSPIDHSEDHARQQRAKAQAMWGGRLLAPSSPVEIYLRDVRGYSGPIPATIGYLPAAKPEHYPAMISAFGFCDEQEPGALKVAADVVRGVHLTLLKPGGISKADIHPNKIMVGPSNGWPIVLAPSNDPLGLIICEGIETGLSLHEATGCGVWAAGCASRMPALAEKVPNYIDCVTVAAEADVAGRIGAEELVRRLKTRGLHVEMRLLGEEARAT